MKKIYDFFLFCNETKMLNLRLHELYDVVEKFIIVESDKTHTGRNKGFNFKIEDYQKFADKIIFKPYYMQTEDVACKNEHNQRRFLANEYDALNINDDDLIMLSDVDEIPDVEFLNNFKHEGFKGGKIFQQNLYYYNYKSIKKEKWLGTVILDSKTFKDNFRLDFEHLRSERHIFDRINAGWHFSYFGDVDFIINKIKSIAHTEFDQPIYTNPETIKNLIIEGKDLFFRGNDDMIILDNVEQHLPNNIHLLD
jgi:beta-1,4-mannosyl-glycoprotein beta-1,4-N-acetylglucosaminyltransferase